MDASKRLNSRQIRFIDAYLANGGNTTDAARQAGYKESSASVQGYKLTRLPEFRHVQLEIKRRQLELQKTYEGDAVQIRRKLWDGITTAHSHMLTPVYDDKGMIIDQVFDAKAAQAMATLAAQLNKMDGNYAVERHRLELSGGVQVDHAQILNEARKRLEESHQQKQELQEKP